MSMKDEEVWKCAAEVASNLTRRRFMQGSTAGVLAAAGMTVPLAGWAQAAPKKGGVLKVGMADGAISDNWNPAVTNTRYMIHMNHVNRNMLTEIKSDNTLGPELAKSWEASADATEWTFELQEGVEFHDGKSFGAEDVIATLNYHRNPETGSAVASLLSSIEEITADGPNTVRIKLASGNADLPYVMTDYHLCILPSDGAGGVVIDQNGTGPYRVVEHSSGIRTALERNLSDVSAYGTDLRFS